MHENCSVQDHFLTTRCEKVECRVRLSAIQVREPLVLVRHTRDLNCEKDMFNYCERFAGLFDFRLYRAGH